MNDEINIATEDFIGAGGPLDKMRAQSVTAMFKIP